MPSGSQTLTAAVRRPRKQFWRDVLIFALLGPVFGFFTVLWIIPLALIATGNGGFNTEVILDPAALKLLPLSYYFGFLPALVTGFVQAWLGRRGTSLPLRVATVVGVGAVTSCLGIALAIGGITGFVGLVLASGMEALTGWLAMGAAAGALAAGACFAHCAFLDTRRLRRAMSV